MRIPFFILSIALTATEAKLDRITSSRKLTPEDIGAYHTDAFDILGEKYSQNKPSSQLDVMMDVGEILAGYCPLDDSACVSNAYKTIMKEFDITAKGMPRTVEYPADFDSDIKQSVESMFSTIYTINEHNLDEVLSSLEDIQYELKDMDGVNKVHQISGLAGVSVAIESTKLWHGTYHDENHPLHGMIGHFDREGGQRKLQETIQNDVVSADVTAALSVALATDLATLLAGPDLDSQTVATIAVAAISASVAAFFGVPTATSPVVIQEEDDDEDDDDDDEDDDENAGDIVGNLLCVFGLVAC